VSSVAVPLCSAEEAVAVVEEVAVVALAEEAVAVVTCCQTCS
jgi:hypothetical protein